METARSRMSAVILTAAAVGQIVLTFLMYNVHGSPAVANAGWAILCVSAVFGWLPILTLRRLGNVPKGEPYVHTTKLVDRGVYAIVRHPQYLAGILMGIALTLIAQHWTVALLGVVVILALYADTYEEEVACLKKFGDEYERYRQRVPRINFLAGIVRVLSARSRPE